MMPTNAELRSKLASAVLSGTKEQQGLSTRINED